MQTSLKTTITAGLLLALSGVADAATKTASFQVSATVTKNCTIEAQNLDLGEFDGTNDLSGQASISIRCTSGTPYDVALSTGSSGSYAARTLVNGSDSLNYNLFTASDHATVWGDGTNSTGQPATGTGAGMGTAQTLTVYGQLLASGNTGAIPAGTYTDSVVATITY
jgi:spore coat protein U-like protein